ncbi:NADH-ubiquinone oxidoreductase chain C [Euzebya pacifica]|uniref:NADH-ubiquinone oxidoreductase chain C n=1 Tax=Euzebya pacifica TaxID=1608957 RepID=A0A346Y402_9ACTN|nr:NADH-quinone oxidoreductase subunit C [Euzebya pacifica]AXV09199.1 NADH-ubiquinone oxidoreductase chain C [Euzebya pacifica]
MTPNALADRFRDELGERVLAADVAHDQLTLTVDPEAYPQVARFCKQTLGMTFFDFLGGVDEREDGFSVVVRVYNHITRDGVLLKTMVPGGRDEPRVATLTDVWRGADWHEREAYDMFGIVFEGHPGLLPRILTVENFEGWPLRKEFLLASREVKPWPGAKEPGGDDEGDAKPKAAAPAPGADPGDRAAAAKAKAERAKAKAAEARKRKAEEKAAAQAAENPTGSEAAGSAPQPEDTERAAAQAGPAPAADGGVDDAEPGSAREAAQAAAGRETSPGTPDPTTPEGAAEIADTAVAKDAAAGSTVGSGMPAPGDKKDSGEPDIDPDVEAQLAKGGPAESGGTPGVEAEGTHDLEDSTARTASVTDEAHPDDAASREAAGVGEAGTGTFAEPTRPDEADVSRGGTPVDTGHTAAEDGVGDAGSTDDENPDEKGSTDE